MKTLRRPKPRFQRGDRVRITGGWGDAIEHHGQVATVRRVFWFACRGVEPGHVVEVDIRKRDRYMTLFERYVEADQ